LAAPLLRDRPVRRVSHLTGRTVVGTGAAAREVDYRFTDADFELVSTAGTDAKDAIRFRPKGRKPVPGSTLTVNYYPVQPGQVPPTDLNVGSVTRTLVETVALELALAYQHLDHVYQSAFLQTADGSSLDNVVALIGLSRLPAGKPVATLRFSRRADTPGRIAVPAGTPVADGAGNRYLTTVELIMEPGESARDVTAAGETAATKVVDQGKLVHLEVAIAGVSTVTNPK